MSVPPDWATLDVPLACPGCGYNLYMLTESRCPECGLGIDWAALITEARRPDSERWLFEHCWRRRPFSSLAETLQATVDPWRTWRRVTLSDRPNPAACYVVLLAAILIDLASIFFTWLLEYLQPPFSLPLTGALEALWQAARDSLLAPLLPMLLFPAIGTVVAASAFRSSLIRRRILFGHLVRVIVFSWSGLLLLDAAMVLGALVLRTLNFPETAEVSSLLSWGIVASFLVFGVFYGFRRYLLLPLAFLASVATTLLGMVIAVVMVSAYAIFLRGSDSELWLGVSERWIPRFDDLLTAFNRWWF